MHTPDPTAAQQFRRWLIDNHHGAPLTLEAACEITVKAAALFGPAVGWQDIETAPKDGTWIAIWCEAGGVKAGFWGPTYFGRDPAWITYAHRSDSEQIWPLPTHWHALPAPPAASEEVGT